MKRALFNVNYTFSFLATFFIILYCYTDVIVQAFTPGVVLFSSEDSLMIQPSQQWSKTIRNFNIDEGDGASEVPVLMYHKIINDQDISSLQENTDSDLDSTIVLKSEFTKQMQYLDDEGYTILNSTEFHMFMDGTLNVPGKSVLITFDDGFKDTYAEAYPILKEHGFTALNFMITGYITDKNSKYKAENYQYLSVSDIEESSDVFEFQSHTYNFHHLTDDGLAYLVAKLPEQIKEDLQTSYSILEPSHRLFAYPYGQFDDDTKQVLSDLQVELAFTIEYKNAEPSMDQLEIPRKGVYPEDTISDFIAKLKHDN